MKFKPPVSKNQELTATVTDLTYQGMGVVKVDGYTLFCDDALPGANGNRAASALGLSCSAQVQTKADSGSFEKSSSGRHRSCRNDRDEGSVPLSQQGPGSRARNEG